MDRERRSEPRWRVEYLATIVSREGGPQYCTVTEMSDGGVRIKTIIYRVLDEFGLRLTGQAIAKRYSVVWRNGRHVGAKLIDAPHR
jgi:PilZ domain